MPRRSYSARGRRAFTLVEMLVVLAVLAGMAAVSWPSVRGMIRKNRLHAAAKQVRETWIASRLDAVQLARPYYFRFQPGTGNYEVRAWDEAAAASGGDAAVGPLDDDGRTTSSETVAETLPDGVVFEFPAEREETILTRGPVAMVSDGAWSEPVWFYPSGRTSNLAIRLRGDDGGTIDVTLRGLIGAAKIGEPQPSPRTSDALPGETSPSNRVAKERTPQERTSRRAEGGSRNADLAPRASQGSTRRAAAREALP